MLSRRAFFFSLAGGAVLAPRLVEAAASAPVKLSTKIGETITIRTPMRYFARDGGAMRLVYEQQRAHNALLSGQLDVFDKMSFPLLPRGLVFDDVVGR